MNSASEDSDIRPANRGTEAKPLSSHALDWLMCGVMFKSCLLCTDIYINTTRNTDTLNGAEHRTSSSSV